MDAEATSLIERRFADVRTTGRGLSSAVGRGISSGSTLLEKSTAQ